MIYPGTCSLTLSQMSLPEVVDCCKLAGLAGIEWWGKDHVPPGDLTAARKAARLTKGAGLRVSSYGSYYRAGESEHEGLSFRTALDTAVNLGAPTIRVWAGAKSSANADAAYVRQVADDLMRAADLAEKAGLTLNIEYHGNTLTDSGDSAFNLARLAEHPAIWFSWQPPVGSGFEACCAGLKRLLPRLGTIHVFHWDKVGDEIVRQPLAAGAERWEKYFSLTDASGRDHWALLEFVKDGAPEQFLADAATLLTVLA